jgi:hypothetical protein
MAEGFGLNLAIHRAPASVWDRRLDGTRERLTVARWLIGVGGGVLAIKGLSQRSVGGSILAGVGAAFAWWALTGDGDLSGARRRFDRLLERIRMSRADPVYAASADSFPASDAPAWTPTVGAEPRFRQRAPTSY